MAKNSERNGELSFDLAKISARDIRDLNKALQSVDVDTAAGIYARVITSCPTEWGAPNDPETYLGLSFFDDFQGIVGKMGEAAKNAKAS